MTRENADICVICVAEVPPRTFKFCYELHCPYRRGSEQCIIWARVQQAYGQVELDKSMELVPVSQPGTNYVLVKEVLFRSQGATSENPLVL